MGHLQRKAAGHEHSQLRREAMWSATGKAIEIGMSKPSGVHIMPMSVLDARHGATGFNVCPGAFMSCFDLILPCYSPNHPFWNGDV
jgi:hypothetical protein